MNFNNTEIAKFIDVSLQYPSGGQVLNKISFTFQSNRFYFLTGESGAGKTTLLKLFYRHLQPTEGQAFVFGIDTSQLKNKDLPLFRQKIGLVFQDCKLLPHLNALDNVALSLKINNFSLKQARGYAKELLVWVGLEDCLEKLPEFLSDGQKQRVTIARAVITKPDLLLADEPTGNLDEKNTNKLMLLLQELHKEGTTIIMATHNRVLVHRYGYPELYLSNGKLSASYDNYF